MIDGIAISESALEDDFQDVLGKALRGRGLSKEYLAKTLEIDVSELTDWLGGRGGPNDAQLTKLADELSLRPHALQDSLAKSWLPHVTVPENVTGYMQFSQPESNGYLVRSGNGEIALVDPAGDADALLARVQASGMRLRYLFVTHRHDDHADAVAAIVAQVPDVAIVMHPTEASTRNELPRIAHPVAHGDRISFGDVAVRALVTPGHTDGSTCFDFGGYVFVGDMLFAGSVGRNFGPHATYNEQLENIRTHIFSLAPKTVLLPGHGPASTVELEREHNPFFP